MRYSLSLATALILLAATLPAAFADSGAPGPSPLPGASSVASNPHLMGDRYQRASAEVRALQLQA
ncbi:MAG: hypothetical protein WBL23_17850 [Salinisphaera sp.]|uniref:hypothetical protein n=1 Tax=Salinisphaera sp. TaxID=1914330 RepID=UPI003C7B6CD7